MYKILKFRTVAIIFALNFTHNNIVIADVTNAQSLQANQQTSVCKTKSIPTPNTSTISIYYSSATDTGTLHQLDRHSNDSSNSIDDAKWLKQLPKDLFTRISELISSYNGKSFPSQLHAPLSLWINDSNQDGNIILSDGDHAFLYSGMHQYGHNYYTFDIADPYSPKILWSIEGGKQSNNFPELGQSWSKAIPTAVRYQGNKRIVLIFGGGYNSQQDDPIGRAIFVVDAITGQRLWWASSIFKADLVIPEMRHSIASDVRLIDLNLDGLTDRLYFGDIGGQLFRIDIHNSDSLTSPFASGARIAVLSDDSKKTEKRKFFSAPDIVLTKTSNHPAYLSINIGSGNKAQALGDTVNNRFYSIRDYDLTPNASENFTLTTESTVYDSLELFDATESIVIDLKERQNLMNKYNGWYMRLENKGEKVLAESLAFRNQVFFTTYSLSTNTNQCQNNTNRLYVVNLHNASPITQSLTNEVSDLLKLTTAHRSIKLESLGTPPKPHIVFKEQPVPCVADQCFPGSLKIAIDKTYWKQLR